MSFDVAFPAKNNGYNPDKNLTLNLIAYINQVGPESKPTSVFKFLVFTC